MLPQAYTLDFETRSAKNLKSASYRQYAGDPSTGVICVAIQSLNNNSPRVYMAEGGRWVFSREDKVPVEILLAILHNIPIYTHNNAFDRRIYECHCVPVLGWPPIPRHLWRCTLALCSYYTLPRKLAQATLALGLPAAKDMAGNKVMLQISKPRKHTKRQIEEWVASGRELKDMPIRWWEDRSKHMRTAMYCLQDVRTQTEILRTLGPLPPERLKEWQFDQEINERGVPVDVPALRRCAALLEQSMAGASQELRRLTATLHCPQGFVQTVMQRDRILEFIQMQGTYMMSLDKATVEQTLEDKTINPVTRRILEIRQTAGKSSIAKVEKMLDLVDADGVIRDGLMWHGASTGRLAGRGVQWHNFPREAFNEDDAREFHHIMQTSANPIPHVTQRFARIIHTKHTDGPMPYVDPLTGFPAVLTNALRSFVTAMYSGHHLLVSDFNAIECRVLAWLSGCRLLLQAFSDGTCPYCQFAMKIFGREVKKSKDNHQMIQDRNMGKVAVLGLGYGMGKDKFVVSAAQPPYNFDLSIEQSEMIVKLFRSTYHEIFDFGAKCEEAMRTAVSTQSVVRYRSLEFGCKGGWGWIKLPSNRAIWYRDLKLVSAPSRFGKNRMTKQLRYMSVVTGTKKWLPTGTYSGKLVENITQGVAADILFAAERRVEDNGFPVILSVHDEVISVTRDKGRKDAFHSLMRVRPSWAPDCPIEAETHVAERYGK